MDSILWKPGMPGQFRKRNLSGPRGALQSGVNVASRLTVACRGARDSTDRAAGERCPANRRGDSANLGLRASRQQAHDRPTAAIRADDQGAAVSDPPEPPIARAEGSLTH